MSKEELAAYIQTLKERSERYYKMHQEAKGEDGGASDEYWGRSAAIDEIINDLEWKEC